MKPVIFMAIASLDPATGGPARSVPNLSEAVNNAGGDIQLFANSVAGVEKDSKDTYPPSFPIHQIDKLDIAVQRYMNVGVHPILHSHGIWLPVNHTVAKLARHHNIPHIISPRGMLEPWALNFRKWKKKLAWLLFQRRDLQTASVLHATAVQEAENFRSLGFRNSIAVIPNGVKLPIYNKPKYENNTPQKALFLSRIHPKKGLINLVHAWKALSNPNWQVIIAGPNESNHKQEVEKEIADLGLTDFFSFTGPIKDDDKWHLYNEVSLFILPTFSENFGIVIAEALASNLPVITTKGTPWAELEEHKCGWWVDIGVEPLVEALNEAMNLSPEERQAMGQRGRQLIEQNYSWETIGKEMVSVYEWVLGMRPQPNCVVTD